MVELAYSQLFEAQQLSDPFITQGIGPDRLNTRLPFKLPKLHVFNEPVSRQQLHQASPRETGEKKKKNLIEPLGVISHHQPWDKSETVNKLICEKQELEIAYL